MHDFSRIAVIGAGAWGTALANAAARNGRRVALIGRDAAAARAIGQTGTNARRLPDIPLATGVSSTADIGEAGDVDLVILAAPAQATRDVAATLRPVIAPGTPIVSCAKGIARDSGLYPSEIVASEIPDAPVAVLSGPSFAHDVARGLPTAVALASADMALAQRIAEALSSPTFRLYRGGDMRGVEIGGAAKNVLAIAAGVVVGRGLGESARAALVARGFAELMRFARAEGARPETLMGLSGLGDLVLTCGSARSRNFAYGVALGRGEAADPAQLAEGAFTAASLVKLSRARGVEMPIADAVDDLVAGRIAVDAAVAALMTRPLRAEMQD